MTLRRSAAIGIAVLLLVCLFSDPSHSQTNAATLKTFSLEDALNYALQNYPAVRASLEQVNAAHAGITLARTQYLPSLSGVYQDSRATQNQVPGIWLPTAITPTVEGPVGDSSSGQSYWGSQAAALFSWEPIDFGLRPLGRRTGEIRRGQIQCRFGGDSAAGGDSSRQLLSNGSGDSTGGGGGAGQRGPLAGIQSIDSHPRR